MRNLFDDEKIFQAIDTLQTCIYWKDLEGKYFACNQYFAEMSGVTHRAEIIGKTDIELFGLDIAEEFQKNDRTTMEQGFFEGEEVVTFPDGKKATYWTVKHRLLDTQGRVAGIAGSSTNILKHHIQMALEKEQAVLDEKAQILQLFDAANTSIYWKDKDGHYLGCNTYVLNMAGFNDPSQIIGKTDAELTWRESAAKLMEVDRSVIENGRYIGEEKLTLADGSWATYLTVKNQLFNNKGEVIGVIGTSHDITEKKEAERRFLESERQRNQIILQEKENFAKLARKVAHDINSPLAALNMMLDVCNELPEDRRAFLRRATESILDIANNLLTSNGQEESSTNVDVEFREPLLVSDLLTNLLSEKKVQYQQHAVKFETRLANDAQFAFIRMQKIEFRRAMSNLINNAVDAFEGAEKGGHPNSSITVHLTTNADFVFVRVQDNGKGMQRSQVEKITARQGFTEGKENGHGLGLQQVWDMLECNEGTMTVESVAGKGTSILLTFPRITAPNWIAQQIHLNASTIIAILDDDDSIHTAWNLRFAPFSTAYPNLRLQHFKQGQEALEFLNTLSRQEKGHVIFLSDYELLHQDKNGLQILEESKVKDATLVTSYYSQPRLRDAAARLNIKILPKQMASVIPIEPCVDVGSV